MESLEALRKTRSVKKMLVTRKVNELRRLVIDDAYSDVVHKFDLVKGVFHDFMTVHNKYHDLLTDDSDILASDKYFCEVECSYIDGLKGVRDYIRSGPELGASQSANHDGTQQTLRPAEGKSVSYVKLPPVPQPDVFRGNPETYPMWKASFNTLVGKHNIGYDEKMFYLKQYTAGEAQSAIEALFLCPDRSSYDAALEILEERFGNTSVVASAFRKKLENWPKIGERDGKALQRFSDFLSQICIAKQTYKSLDILSDEFENKKILNKLPVLLVNKWIEKVVNNESLPNFDEFSNFLKEKAAIANHALWDGITSGNSSASVRKVQRSKPESRVQGQAYVVQTGTPVRQVQDSQTVPRDCPVCGDRHKAAKCNIFCGMSLSDRRSAIRDKNMCFGCLARGHHSKECKNRHVCAVCSKRHPTLLHDYSLQSQSGTAPVSDNVNLATDFTSTIRTGNRVTTMIIPVVLRHSSSDKEVMIYAVLDTQSNTNFVTEEVVNLLDVSGRHTNLELTTMSGCTKLPTMAIDGLEVRSVTSGPYIAISSCYMRDSIPCRRESIPKADVCTKWPHLSHITLPQYHKNVPIGLLIGYHCPQVMRPLEIATGGDYEPFGWKTSLGWCIVGAPCTPGDGNMYDFGATHIVQGCIAFKSECREVMLNVHDAELTMPGMDEKYSVEDMRFMEIMSQTMHQREDRHYEAPLPLKTKAPFPLNKSVAQRRLMNLKGKFQKDPSYHQKYTEAMQEMLDNEFAEIIPPDEISSVGRTWYIPHHGVQQTNKLRVVFDCSSEFQGVSLNDRLLQGPNLLNLLLGILFRFRLEPIGITCDIQKMYYQFMVPPGDKDLLRYLWWDKGNINSEPVDCRMRVHLFGATSSPGVATYALRRIAKDYGKGHAEEAALFVQRDFYVDDGVTSVNSVVAACTLITETQNLLAEGGCKCHKVMSNCSEVLRSVRNEDRAPIQESGMYKTLGIQWNVEKDEFHLPLNYHKCDTGEITRRTLLSTLAKIYDPLGFISPLVHQAKLLLHQLCRDNYGWDDMLPGDMLKKYKDWCGKCDKLGVVTRPRCVRSCKEMIAPEIHHFADASSTGYAACSYLRFFDEDGNVHVTFMIGKCRVVPIKPVLSIPRLELVAAVLSVDLATKLRKELPLQYEEYFWTDSTVVLGYIQNVSARFKVFVANRVQKILDGSCPEQWFHVDSAQNPADDGSRAVFSERWLQGPSFLKSNDLNIQPINPEISPDDIEVSCMSSHGNESEAVTVRVFRNWFSTLKVWAWVFRFINNCRGTRTKGSLTVDEMELAKTALVRIAQRACFEKEIEDLSSQKSVSRHSVLFKLDAFLDEDCLIRVGGRIHASTLSDEVKHPIILPSDHELSQQIIQHFHQKTHHQGRGMTCSEVRNNGFWILSLQKMVKRLIRTCVTCIRLRGKPIEQKMADLPEDRLSPYYPFWFTGCDLFGPFVVKSGRKECKRYGAMFTCLVSRAVHIEVVHSLSTDSFINAFKRFVAIRGPVRKIRCDQGTNFVGAKNELLKMGCDMVLNPPAASHRGGVWERMIGVARRVIEGILCEHGSRLDDEGLMTVLCEATSVVNSRPLNVDNISDPQSLEPLTPNHLITMKSKVIPRNLVMEHMEPSHLYASKQWRRVQYLIDLFWSRWKKEIVHKFQSRAKWNTSRQNLVVGDLVLIIDDQCHRSYWKIGRVVEVFPSKDDLVRSVNVQLADRSILKRSVQKLVKLLCQ